MTTSVESGIPGGYSFAGTIHHRNWKLPVVLALSAAAAIGLLLFGMHLRTETQLLKMQYAMQEMQAAADSRVAVATHDLATMTRKVGSLEKTVSRMRAEMIELRALSASSKEDRKNTVNKPISRPGQRGQTPRKPGLEDLPFSGNLHLSAAEDDPTVGFGKDEFL